MNVFYAALFALGLIVGSFLNVVSLRFGFREAHRSRSACPSCNAELKWHELVPLASFLAQRGVCRHCGSALSMQYPLVELGVGILFLLAGSAAPQPLNILGFAHLAAVLFFLSSFSLLVVYDIRHTLVPSRFAWALFVGALLIPLLEAAGSPHALAPLLDSAFGALSLGGFFALLILITRGSGMGRGDVYVAASVGVFFGLERGIEAVTIAFWTGALVGVSLIGATRILRKFFPHARLPTALAGVRMKSEVPFVPFLFLGTLIGMFGNFSPLSFVEYLLSL